MKKLLTILSDIILVGSANTSVIACGSDKAKPISHLFHH